MRRRFMRRINTALPGFAMYGEAGAKTRGQGVGRCPERV